MIKLRDVFNDEEMVKIRAFIKLFKATRVWVVEND